MPYTSPKWRAQLISITGPIPVTMYQFAQGFAAVGLLLWFLRILLDWLAERNPKKEAPAELASEQPMDTLKAPSMLEHHP